MSYWRVLPELLAHEDLVLVTIAQTRGSVPREAGTSMLVSMTRTVDTIGGGHLEWEAMAHARAMLLQASSTPALQRLSLGASLGQCCGGVVWLVFERIAQADRDVWIARSKKIESGTALTRKLFSNGSSQWTICSPDEAKRNPGAYLQTNPVLSPGSSSHPLPSLGEGTTEAGPEGRLSLSHAWGEARVSRGMPRAREADWQCSASRGAQSGVPRQGREREGVAQQEAASTWHFTQQITPQKFNITIFGAGHVGAAIINVLSTLEDAKIRWVDVRDDLFGNAPPKVTCITTDTPEDEVDNATSDTFFLVLTHSHALDLELTTRILKRDAFAWFGLIGSRTKRARFEHRLHAQGIPAAQLARMTCPIGVAGIASKLPQVIAVAVVAQLLQAKELHDRHPNHMELAHERS